MRFSLSRELPFVGVIALVGCLGGASVNAPLTGATIDWATSALAAKPQSTKALHLAAQPSMRGSFGTTRGLLDAAKAAMEGASQVDVYDDESLVVIHDAPASIDPTHSYNPPYPADFSFLSQSPSGVRSFTRSGSDRSEPPEVVLLIQPPSTWFFGDRLVLARLALTLGSAPPPRLPSHERSVADTFVTHARPPGWWPFADQSIGGGVILYAFPPAGPAPFAIQVTYGDRGVAKNAATDIERLWKAGELRPQDSSPDDDKETDDFARHIASVTTEGSTVIVRSNVSTQSADYLAENL